MQPPLAARLRPPPHKCVCPLLVERPSPLVWVPGIAPRLLLWRRRLGRRNKHHSRHGLTRNFFVAFGCLFTEGFYLHEYGYHYESYYYSCIQPYHLLWSLARGRRVTLFGNR
jgi:hypothetical protein